MKYTCSERGYGNTVQRSIAYAWVPAAVEVGDEVEVDIFGEWIRGEVAANRSTTGPAHARATEEFGPSGR